MDFHFGAASGRMELTKEMGQVWNDFSTWAGCLPFQYTRITFRAHPLDVDGVAGTDLVTDGHSEYKGNEIGRIFVDAQRFLPLSGQKRNLTLLHECCHLSSFTRELRKTYQAKLEAIAQEAATGENGQPLLNEFDRAKCWLGRGLADQLLECHAERILQSEYPRYGEIRADYFLEMRRDAIACQRWVQFPESLKPYGLLLELLRIELGEMISRSQQSLDELRTLQRSIEVKLQLYPEASARLAALQDALRPSSLVDNFEPRASATYQDVVNQMLSV